MAVYIRSPADMHPEKADGALWFPAREVAELLKKPWPRLKPQTAPWETRRTYRYRRGYRSFVETMVRESAVRHMVALYWDQPSAAWRAYVDTLREH